MMKAIQVAATGGVEVLQIASVARPALQPGHVLVRNAFSGVNYIDTYHRTGLYPLPLPFIPGREASGVIDDVAADVRISVKDFKKGDRVVWIGPGSYAEYTAVPTNKVYPLPGSVSFEDGATALIQGLTALSLVRLAYEVKRGDTVLVHAAAGGTGRLLVQLAAHYGATVIATTSTAEKAAEATRLGAAHVVRYDSEDVAERVRAITGGLGVHAVFDGVGRSTFDASLASLRKRGYMISFGNASGKVPDVDIARLAKGNVYLARPTLFDYIDTKEAFYELSAELFRLISEKKLEMKIHKVFPLEQAANAHEEIEGRKSVGKILLEILH